MTDSKIFYVRLISFFAETSDSVDVKNVSAFTEYYKSNIQKKALDILYFCEQTNVVLSNSLIAEEIYGYNDNQIFALQKSVERLSEDVSNDENMYINKFIDKINLSIVQRDFILQNVNTLKNETAGVHEELENIKTTKSSIYSEFIAILGIFSALVFGVFGGFDAFKEMLSNLKDVSVGKVLMFSSLLMCGLTILVFLLLQAIGIISNKHYLACGCLKTTDCSHNFFDRYPLFMFAISGFSFIFSIGCLIYYVPLNKSIITSIIILSLLVIAGYICWQIFKTKKNKPNSL